MKKKTLAELEQAAERHWEKEAKRLVQAIAERENVEFDELYPYLVDYAFGNGYLYAAFKFPEHTLIQLSGGYGNNPPLELTEKGLKGDYGFMVWIPKRVGTPSFVGHWNLGDALLMARWSYEQDKRALWK